MLQTKSRAFTLVELMIVISIVAVLAAIAMPSFSTLISNREADIASVTLKQHLIFARNSAKTESQDIAVTPISDEFENGWTITGLSDGRTLRQADALATGLNVTSTSGTNSSNPIVFSGSSGRVVGSGGDVLQIRSAGCSGDSDADITILTSGQIYLTNVGC